MKVGILIDRLNIGGVEKIALEEVRALRYIGENAYLVVMRKRGVVNNAFPDLQKQVPIIFLDQRLPKFFRYSFQFPIFHFFSLFHITYPLLIPFVVKRAEFDYLIVHGTYTAFTAITIRLFKRIPFSVFIWDPISYIIGRVYSNKISPILSKILIFVATFIDKFILRNTDYILTGGSAHNRIFHQLDASKKIVAIPPGINPSTNISQKKKNFILMVTAWKRGKNPEYIFELIKKAPYLKFKLIGKWIDPEYEIEFKNKIRKRGLIKNIMVTGGVSEAKLNSYYQEALFLLQTNDDKGFGMPALEAATNGTTFIIPRGQGVCSLFIDGTDGFYTKENDTNTIITYINRLMQNKPLAIKMGVAAKRKVEKKYGWNIHAKKLIKLYK